MALRGCLKKKVITDSLPPELIAQLDEFAKRRNSFVHGEPPTKSENRELMAFARESLENCLKAYRLVNLGST